MPDPSVRPLIFISYSHKDWRSLQFVQGHLSVGEQNYHFDTWTDQKIGGGEDWAKDIVNVLRACHVFILLVSRNSLTSSFILNNELRVALEHAHCRGTRIFPIITEACDIEAVPWLMKMNIRPRDAKPLEGFPKAARNQVMASIAKEIREIVSRDLEPVKTKSGAARPAAVSSTHAGTGEKFSARIQLLQVSSNIKASGKL